MTQASKSAECKATTDAVRSGLDDAESYRQLAGSVVGMVPVSTNIRICEDWYSISHGKIVSPALSGLYDGITSVKVTAG
jgi:hypothetical protein